MCTEFPGSPSTPSTPCYFPGVPPARGVLPLVSQVGGTPITHGSLQYLGGSRGASDPLSE